MELLERLEALEERYESLAAQMGDPAIAGDPDRYRQIAKTYSDLERIVTRYREFRRLQDHLRESQALLDDPELKAMAREEVAALEPKREAMLVELRALLLPKDPNDEKNVILEIRAGTGGEEASLFAAELFRMYTRYAERRGWQLETLTMSTSGLGGLKEVIALIEGKGAYSKLKYESGVHRVQRVPQTETQGKGSHLRNHRRGAAGGGRSRHQDRSQRPPHRHLLLLGPRGPVGEHDVLGGTYHAHPHEYGGQLPGREVAD